MAMARAMSQAKHIAMALLLTFATLTAVTSCGSSESDRTVRQGVEDANLNLPMESSPGITIEKIRIDSATVVYTYTLDGDLHNLDNMRNSPTFADDLKRAMIVNDGSPQAVFINDIAQSGYNLKAVYTTPGDSLSVVITNDEIHALLNEQSTTNN